MHKSREMNYSNAAAPPLENLETPNPFPLKLSRPPRCIIVKSHKTP